MNLPLDITELRERWQAGERFEFCLFYGHKPPLNGVDGSCLSQWFVRDFVVDGQNYPTAEHWMMAEKARLFDDQQMLKAILENDSPKDVKAFGRKVRKFEPAVWDQHKFEIVVRGNVAKFEQNDDLKEFLLGTATPNPIVLDRVAEDRAKYDTSNTETVSESPITFKISDYAEAAKPASIPILVEAAGRDLVWGIGYGSKNPKSYDPMQWRGKNLLGFALNKVRQQFLDERDE